MKLTDLEPLLDPRRPLHFATDATHRPGRASIARPVRISAGRPAGAPVGPRTDQARTITRPGGPTPVGQRVESVSAVRMRAATAVRMFTGGATGLLTALWAQEAGTTGGRLLTVDGGPDVDAATSDALGQAVAARDVHALSPEVAAHFAAVPFTADRLADGLARRSRWGSGVLWSPRRQTLLTWSTGGDGIRLVLIAGADLAAWATSLTGAAPTALRVRSLHLPTDHDAAASLLDDAWRPAIAELVRLAGLGHVGAAIRTPIARDGVPPVPVTRYLMTSAETRSGILPIDLLTGTAPRGVAGTDWQPARYREIFSAAQSRRIRVFSDAAPTSGRPPFEPILVTVLPH